MGEKDKIQKNVEEHNDVYADIINVLLFNNEVINEHYLNDYSTETSFTNITNGKMYSRFRDIRKLYKGDNLPCITFSIENQTDECKFMPVRVMGYDWTVYTRQIARGFKELQPVITIVLNFSNKRWSKGKSIKELMKVPDELKNYIQDYNIKVFDVAFLPDKLRKKFKSDFRIIADFFYSKRTGAKMDYNIPIKHVEDMLQFFRVFADDKGYDEIKDAILNRQKNGEVITMCTWAQEMYNNGLNSGLEQGITATVETAVELGADYDKAIDLAANKFNIDKCKVAFILKGKNK